MIFDEPGVIGAGAGGGFQALNLAVQFGARDIALVGYDHTTAHGLHWHGEHKGQLENPTDLTAMMWRQYMDVAALDFRAHGVAVVNCSPASALTCFPKQNLSEWLDEGVA